MSSQWDMLGLFAHRVRDNKPRGVQTMPVQRSVDDVRAANSPEEHERRGVVAHRNHLMQRLLELNFRAVSIATKEAAARCSSSHARADEDGWPRNCSALPRPPLSTAQGCKTRRPKWAGAKSAETGEFCTDAFASMYARLHCSLQRSRQQSVHRRARARIPVLRPSSANLRSHFHHSPSGPGAEPAR